MGEQGCLGVYNEHNRAGRAQISALSILWGGSDFDNLGCHPGQAEIRGEQEREKRNHSKTKAYCIFPVPQKPRVSSHPVPSNEPLSVIRGEHCLESYDCGSGSKVGNSRNASDDWRSSWAPKRWQTVAEQMSKKKNAIFDGEWLIKLRFG